MTEQRIKDCYCFTCKKGVHHLGIASHRAMHRRREENCEIRYSTGKRLLHIYTLDLNRALRERG